MTAPFEPPARRRIDTTLWWLILHPTVGAVLIVGAAITVFCVAIDFAAWFDLWNPPVFAFLVAWIPLVAATGMVMESSVRLRAWSAYWNHVYRDIVRRTP